MTSQDSHQNQTQETLRRWLPLISMTAVALVTLLLYGRALDFAFFNDDPSGHYAWMEGRSIVDFFRSSAEYGYYRPLVFAALRSLVRIAGYNASVHHGLLLLLNSTNAAMLWLLAWRLSGSGAYAWAAAVIFITFPFSYEAVAYVASLTHPLLLFWLLLTLLLYDRARRSGSRVLYGAAFATLLLGLLSHENGLFIPLALIGLDWLQRPPHGWRDAVERPFLAYVAAAILFFLLWLLIPKNSEQGLGSLNDIASNLLPFLQSLVYPLLPLIQLTAEQEFALIVLAVLLPLALLGAAALAGATRLWLFALGWFALSLLPALLFLSPAYVAGSPRLHYLPAVGVALLLALPVLALVRRARKRPPAHALVGLVAVSYTALVALPPLSFIRCELDFYGEASTIVRDMARLGRAVPEEQDLLFVNVPFYFSSYADYPQGCQNPYPWTPVGAVVIPPYAEARDFVRFNGGPDRVVSAVTVSEYAPGWNTFGQTLPLSDLRQRLVEGAIFIYDLNDGGFFTLSDHWQPGNLQAQTTLATFGNAVALQEREVAMPGTGDEIAIRLQWQALRQPDIPLSAFVHLYGPNGALIGQHDGPPGGSFVPATSWKAGDTINDTYTIALEAPLPSGNYTLATGLYNSLDGQRLAAESGGERLSDDIYIVEELTIR